MSAGTRRRRYRAREHSLQFEGPRAGGGRHGLCSCDEVIVADTAAAVRDGYNEHRFEAAQAEEER